MRRRTNEHVCRIDRAIHYIRLGAFFQVYNLILTTNLVVKLRFKCITLILEVLEILPKQPLGKTSVYRFY